MLVRHEDVVEEDLGEARLTVELADRPDRHSVRVERHQQVGQATMPGRLRVGPEQTEQPVGERRP